MKKLLIIFALIFFACGGNDTILKDALNLNSFNKNPTPLYVLDGVIISNLDSVAPSSIAKIYVLKGEKATDKYGQKGNHGVIEVISKKATTSHSKL